MTAQSIIDIALDILSERRPDGTRPVDISYFTSRAVSYINITLAEAAPYNAILTGRELDFVPVASLEDDITCDPQLAYTALPYNIAALYMLSEEDDRYSLYRALFENALLKSTKIGKSRIHSITDVY